MGNRFRGNGSCNSSLRNPVPILFPHQQPINGFRGLKQPEGTRRSSQDRLIGASPVSFPIRRPHWLDYCVVETLSAQNRSEVMNAKPGLAAEVISEFLGTFVLF